MDESERGRPTPPTPLMGYSRHGGSSNAQAFGHHRVAAPVAQAPTSESRSPVIR